MSETTEVIRFIAKDDASAVIKSIAAGAAAATGLIAAAYLKSATAAAMAERSERRLFTAMKLQGGISKSAFEDLKRFNSGLELKLGLDADNLAQIQGTLSAQGVANDQLDEATKQTLGLAEVTGSLESAGKLVARMYDGNISSLKRYLPAVNSVEQAQEELTKLFSLTEANADDLITKFDVLTRTLENTQETLGKNATINDALSGGTQILTDVTRVFNANVDSGEGIIMSSVTALSQLNEEILGFSIPGLIGMTNALEDDKRALDAVAEGADAARKAIEAFNQASGFVEFGGETITSDPKKIKRDRDRAKAKAQRDRERRATERGDSLAIMGQGTLADMTGLGGFDAREFGGSGLGEFKGTPLAEYEQKQTGIADAAAKHQSAVDKIKSANDELNESFVQSGLTAANAFARMGSAAMDGSLTTQDALKLIGVAVLESSGAVASAAISKITASAAVSAGTQAEKAAQELPWPAGIAVIPGIIAAVTGMFAGLLQGFNKGGLVRGGQPGRDSVPALLTPGEFVLTKDVVDDIRAGRSPKRSVSGGRSMAAPMPMLQGAPWMMPQIQVQQLVPDRDVAFRRSMRGTVIPELERLARDRSMIRKFRSFGPEG